MTQKCRGGLMVLRLTCSHVGGMGMGSYDTNAAVLCQHVPAPVGWVHAAPRHNGAPGPDGGRVGNGKHSRRKAGFLCSKPQEGHRKGTGTGYLPLKTRRSLITLLGDNKHKTRICPWISGATTSAHRTAEVKKTTNHGWFEVQRKNSCKPQTV